VEERANAGAKMEVLAPTYIEEEEQRSGLEE
jgi:hypothetical protein